MNLSIILQITMSHATPGDTPATPLRHPPYFDYSSTLPTIIEGFLLFCDTPRDFLARVCYKNKLYIWGFKFELRQKYGKET